MRTALHGFTQRHHFSGGQSYDRHAGRVFAGLYGRVAEDVAGAAPQGGVVLDAGCGTGQLAALVATCRPDVRVRGIDLEPAMVEVATARARRTGVAERVEFTVADLAHTPLPDASVDLVVSTASLHHWTDVPAVVSELQQVLRPGGRLWIYDMRWVSRRGVRSGASGPVMRARIRTGRLPLALFQRLSLAPPR